VTLRREPFPVLEHIGEGENVLVPFRGGETLRWRATD
jgi:dihydroorotase